MCVCSIPCVTWVKGGLAEPSLLGKFVIKPLEYRRRALVSSVEDVTCCDPCIRAAITAAPRTECALNMEVSIPAFFSILLSHRAMVELEATLCGLMVVRKRGFDPSSLLNSSVYPRMLAVSSLGTIMGLS